MIEGAKPSSTELRRLEITKDFSTKSSTAIAYVKADDTDGGVIYINPLADAAEVRKSLIILASQIEG